MKARHQSEIGQRQLVSMSKPDGLPVVRAEIARACRDAGRDPASVTLVAVSKTFGADAIEPLVTEAGRVADEWEGEIVAL